MIICVIRRLESVISRGEKCDSNVLCPFPPAKKRIVDATLPGQAPSAGRAVIWRAVGARITLVGLRPSIDGDEILSTVDSDSSDRPAHNLLLTSSLRSAQSPRDGSPYLYWRNPYSLSLYLTSLVWPFSIHPYQTRIASVNAGDGGKLVSRVVSIPGPPDVPASSVTHILASSGCMHIYSLKTRQRHISAIVQ